MHALSQANRSAQLDQLELGFSTSYQVVPTGRADVFQVRVTTTPRLGERQLTTADVAESLGISVRQASRLLASGAIPCHRPGVLHRRVYQRDLDAWQRSRGMAV